MSFEATIPSHVVIASQDRLARLFDHHHQRLYALARRLSGNAEEARDLVQDSFLRAARHLGRIPATDQGAEAWLVRILVNLCRDRLRRFEVRRRAAETVLKAEPPTVDAENPIIARTAVRAALGTLDARRRAVVVLHELEERPIKEVARLLGIAPVTARWHLSKARRQLAAVLDDTSSMSQTRMVVSEEDPS